MRHLLVPGVAALAAGLGFTAAPAAAFDWDHASPPPGWGREQVVRHWVYAPRYHHIHYQHATTNPYAYYYQRPHYYPYTGSQYWVPAERMRNRYRYRYHGPQYRYAPAWGHPAEHSDAPHPGHHRAPVK